MTDSYSQRTEVRKALSQDEKWQNEFVVHFMPMLLKQVNMKVWLLSQDCGIYSINHLCILYITLTKILQKIKDARHKEKRACILTV